jgi:hypothetical protein
MLDSASEIGLAHLTAAIAVWRYCEASAAYVFGKASGDCTVDAIRDLLRDTPDGCTRTDVSNYFKRHRTKEQLDRALKTLEQDGEIFKEVNLTLGRPSERWFAVVREIGETSERSEPLE